MTEAFGSAVQARSTAFSRKCLTCKRSLVRRLTEARLTGFGTRLGAAQASKGLVRRIMPAGWFAYREVRTTIEHADGRSHAP